MGRLVWRLLVLTCAIELALPTGWCCRIEAGEGPVEESAPARSPACSCCCAVAQPEPAAPETPDARRPAPISSCCCKPQQATLEKDQPSADPVALVCWQPLVDDIAAAGGVQWFAKIQPIPSPPLHLLHSVWLC